MVRGWTKSGLVAAFCALGMTAGQAAAADLGHGPSIKDAPVSTGYSWSGFYVGGHAGLANGSADASLALFNTETDLTGALYGVHAGYNFQRGAHVFGIEGSWSRSNVEGSTQCFFVITCTGEVDWVATLVGRAGLAMNHTLLYGFGGVAWGKVNAVGSLGPVFTLSGDETHTGWTAGFGLEHALNERVSFRIEYAHIDLGSETHNLTGSGFPVSIPVKVDATLDTVRLGVNVKLTH